MLSVSTLVYSFSNSPHLLYLSIDIEWLLIDFPSHLFTLCTTQFFALKVGIRVRTQTKENCIQIQSISCRQHLYVVKYHLICARQMPFTRSFVISK